MKLSSKVKNRIIKKLIVFFTFVTIGIFSVAIIIKLSKNDKVDKLSFVNDAINIIENSISKNESLENDEVDPAPDSEPEPDPEPTPEPETTPETDVIPEIETPVVPPAPEPIVPEAGTSIATYVQNLHVVGIGDSVMLGAVNTLYATFPNGYFDGKVSRQIIHAYDIITNLKSMGALGDPVIINLGANSYYNDDYKKAVVDLVDGRDVFWLTVTDDYKVNINASLRNLGEQIPNLHIIDWEAISAGHPEYFGADGLHLTGVGQIAYTNAIYSALCSFYLQKYPELNE